MRFRSPAALGLCACASILIAACSDAPTQPAVLMTPETQAAIRIASVLPTLPQLLDSALNAKTTTAALDDTHKAILLHARNTWQLAEVLGETDQGRALRQQAYDEAVPVLAPLVSDIQLEA